jgi:hypothetical protein
MKEPNAGFLELLVSKRRQFRKQQVVAERCVLSVEKAVAQDVMAFSRHEITSFVRLLSWDLLAQQACTSLVLPAA